MTYKITIECKTKEERNDLINILKVKEKAEHFDDLIKESKLNKFVNKEWITNLKDDVQGTQEAKEETKVVTLGDLIKPNEKMALLVVLGLLFYTILFGTFINHQAVQTLFGFTIFAIVFGIMYVVLFRKG